ncbi:MAG: hypothetical protein U0176_03740 [Bacteroidia bacterium]
MDTPENENPRIRVPIPQLQLRLEDAYLEHDDDIKGKLVAGGHEGNGAHPDGPEPDSNGMQGQEWAGKVVGDGILANKCALGEHHPGKRTR